MKRMTLVFAILTMFVSCKKESSIEYNLAGTWEMTKIIYYENDTLKSENDIEKGSVYYQFYSCETGHISSCDMSVLQDGEETYYSYSFDSHNKIISLDSSVFGVIVLDKSTLILEKNGEHFKHQYRFFRKE